MSDDTALLESEARHFHKVFFKRDPPSVVLGRYAAANRLCVPPLDASAERRVHMIVSRGLDVEAIELALRWLRRDTLLTRKIQILFYLVEVRADYYDYFIRQDGSFSSACGRLLRALLSTVYKFLKGTYLIGRYGLV